MAKKRKTKPRARTNLKPASPGAFASGFAAADNWGTLYPTAADVEPDIGIMLVAWEWHYGPLSEDFVPPMFEWHEDGLLTAAPWMATFRDAMLAKYGLFELVEPRVKFILCMLAAFVVDEMDDSFFS